MDDLSRFYQSYINRYEQAVQAIKKQLFYVAVVRLTAFAAFLFFVYRFMVNQQTFLAVLSLFSLAAFLYFVKRSTTLTNQKVANENLLFINRNELGMINGETNKFDNGDSERSHEEYYEDLDIFGEGSLFQLLNRTSTSHGKAALAELLKHSLLNADYFNAQQQAVKVMSPQHTERQLITAGALQEKDTKGSLTDLTTWLNQPPVALTNKWMLFARYALPLLSLITLLISLYLDHFYFLTLVAFISWLHVGYLAKYTNQQNLILGKKQEVLNSYATILREFNKVKTGDADILKRLHQQTQSANTEIKKLAQLVNLLDQRLNILVNIFLNSFLLYDVQCILALEKWKLNNRAHLAEWIQSVGQIECLTSLSTYAFNHPENNYPGLVKDALLIEGNDVYHPLIPTIASVSNNVNIGITNKLLLITGSNMSGKTTYLRTVGINILMAQCGLPVCAASFRFSPVRIYSSIRISDSLQEHTSYFMAELKRLQYIKKSIENNGPSLVLIDEILRGTNSEDKFHGSEQFVQQLIKHNSLTLFATHDLKLSTLEDQYPGVIANYCFESIIEHEELIFDYRMLRGVAKNKNASFLMKKMQII
jgi:DNA mismatch repair ATPase MutS